MNRTAVINVVGLTEPLIGDHTPALRGFSQERAAISPVTPAVTCSAQATYLTGKAPSEHGIVGNGWYFRDLNEIWLWRQSNKLIQGEKIWQTAQRRDSAFQCANTFWWYAMNTTAEYSLTPRPLYGVDGLKLPDFYAKPLELRPQLKAELGDFPLFEFWGPRTTIRSSDWIARAAMSIEEKFAPSMQLVYLPHLDYVLQRNGPESDLAKDLGEIDAVCAKLFDFFRDRGVRVVVLSEYGIMPVSRPVHPNRILREAGYINVKLDLGLEYLDPGTCRAFCVSDHQISHVYIEHERDIPAVRELFESTPGVARVLDDEGKRELGLAHSRSGELVLLAEPDSWFSYYFWLDDSVAPAYARLVDIHNKPGYDPVELFIDPAIRLPMLKAATILARKKLGFRYKMELTPLDATLVKGSHGIVTDDPGNRPVLMSSEPRLLPDASIPATAVRDLLLDHVFAE